MRVQRGRQLFASLLSVALLSALLVAAGSLPAAAAPGYFRPLAPARLMDTRIALGGTAFGSGESRSLKVAGVGGVPVGAVGVVLNVTVTSPTSPGYLTVWPAPLAQPATSNVNFAAGQTVANMVTVGLGASGSVTIANSVGSSQVLVDVMGYFVGGFTGLVPARLMDTRVGLGGATFAAKESRALSVGGVAGIPANSVAVALNVTATNPTAAGFVTVWPAGTAMPTSSNLNVSAGSTVSNMVLVGLSVDGQIDLYNDNGTADLLVDVMGWFTVGGGFTGVVPVRTLDTRVATCGLTLGQGETRTLAVTGAGGVPAEAVGAAALNVTATNPTQSSFLTVWPAGQVRPATSNLNTTAGMSVANMVAVGVGSGGQVNIYNAAGTVDVLVDVMGYFDGDVPFGSAVPCPPHVESFGDGAHVVGTDIAPGRYVTAGTANCSWQRTNGFYGTLGEELASDLGSGQRIVDINPGDVRFIATRCRTWSTFTASSYTPTSSFADGVYAVGSQIVPGRYVTIAGATSCYWGRLSGFSGIAGERITNNLGSGQRIVDILAGDTGFVTSGCGTWTLLSAQPVSPASTFVDGVYAVGSQVQPGQYEAIATSACAWERRSGFARTPGSSELIATGSGTGPIFLTIAATDAGVVSTGCGTWNRIGS